MLCLSLATLALLAPATTFAAHLNARTDDPGTPLPPASNLPTGWSYTGCYTDDPNSRTLPLAYLQDDDNMTAAECISFCAGKGYPYAGTEYYQECYCGIEVEVPTSDQCTFPCRGDATQACGGPGAITIYENPSLMPHVNPGPDCWKSIGCYDDPTSARTLERRQPTCGGNGALTVSLCTQTCAQQGFTLAGVEYGGGEFCLIA
jgi:hypothetical protein